MKLQMFVIILFLDSIGNVTTYLRTMLKIIIITQMEYNGCFYDAKSAMSLVNNIITKNIKYIPFV